MWFLRVCHNISTDLYKLPLRGVFGRAILINLWPVTETISSYAGEHNGEAGINQTVTCNLKKNSSTRSGTSTQLFYVQVATSAS